jgi:hypothetical protein
MDMRYLPCYWKAIGMIAYKCARVEFPVYVLAGCAGASFEDWSALAALGRASDVRVRVGDEGCRRCDLQNSLRPLDYHLEGNDTGIQIRGRHERQAHAVNLERRGQPP